MGGLLIVVPGLSADRARWDDMKSELEANSTFKGRQFTWEYFDHKITKMSFVRLEQIAVALDAFISEKWTKRGKYDDIVLVGHSLGALVARKAWLNSVDPSQGDDYSRSAWGLVVSRFVLFAGMSRGIDTEKTISRKISSRIVETMPIHFTISDCYKGSAFITNLRISWINYLSTNPTRQPITVQLLGSQDDIVSAADNIDLYAFPNTTPKRIWEGGHDTLHHINGISDKEGRLAVIIEAFTEGKPESRSENYKDRRVVMIIHGIRASNNDNWVEDAVKMISERWPGVVSRRPTYGYLSALRFALPMVRKRYARYFRDFYTETISMYRGANISLLAHSNGTYSLARCLAEFQAITVKRVCLAGSVLPATFRWLPFLENHQVAKVRNDCGANDFPVAILCSALRGIGMRDIGTGGFDGFFGDDRLIANNRYFKGGHGAMLGVENLESMLKFLLNDDDSATTVELTKSVWRMRAASRLAHIVAPVIVFLVVAIMIYNLGTANWIVSTIVIAALTITVVVLDII